MFNKIPYSYNKLGARKDCTSFVIDTQFTENNVVEFNLRQTVLNKPFHVDWRRWNI